MFKHVSRCLFFSPDSTPMKKSTSLLDIPMYSTPLTNYPQNGLQINGYPNGTDTFKQTFTPFPSTQVLQDKIEQQSLVRYLCNTLSYNLSCYDPRQRLIDCTVFNVIFNIISIILVASSASIHAFLEYYYFKISGYFYA